MDRKSKKIIPPIEEDFDTAVRLMFHPQIKSAEKHIAERERKEKKETENKKSKKSGT